MKYLAILLGLVVYARHDTTSLLASLVGAQPKAIYYSVGGIQETVLWAVIAVMLLQYRHAVWRSAAIGACVIGIVEGIQLPLCMIGWNEKSKGNICDAWTGLPVGGTIAASYLISICYFFRKHAEELKSIGYLRILFTFLGSLVVAFDVSPLAGFAVLIICLAI